MILSVLERLGIYIVALNKMHFLLILMLLGCLWREMKWQNIIFAFCLQSDIITANTAYQDNQNVQFYSNLYLKTKSKVVCSKMLEELEQSSLLSTKSSGWLLPARFIYIEITTNFSVRYILHCHNSVTLVYK